VGQSAADSVRTALIARADLARIKGDTAAPVWLVVISDFQCPFCKQWHDETAARIDREYVRTGKVRVAYLNYPISTHRNARPAHEAAMCAAEQGAFWPMADALFATQDAWKNRGDPRAFFDSLAATLPLDHARLTRCVQEGTLRTLIQADVDRIMNRGVGSTPTFFAGPYVLVGAQPFAAFKQALDRALATAAAERR
jgi:protein-disulfide isomerase